MGVAGQVIQRPQSAPTERDAPARGTLFGPADRTVPAVLAGNGKAMLPSRGGHLVLANPHDVAPMVRAELEELLRTHVLDPAATIGRDLPVFGITGLMTSPDERFRSEQFGSWYFVDAFKDPTLRTFGGQPIPEKIHDELRPVADGRVRLSRIVVGHQLPDDLPDDAPLPQLVPDPPWIRRADEGLVRFADSFAKGSLMVLGGLLAGTAAVVAAPALVAGMATAGLDPIVLGGVDHPTEPATIWAVLAQWDWPEE